MVGPFRVSLGPAVKAFAGLITGMLVGPLSCAAEPVQGATLTLVDCETAGISGFRAMWDTPVVLGADGLTKVVDKGASGKAPTAYWSPAARPNGERGALVFDAIHRSLLVRFPGAGVAIAARLGEGQAIAKAELILTFKDTEFWPEGYIDPAGMSFLGDRWVTNPPTWHAVVWALRRPWLADAELGPTFNAFLNGVGYWAKWGAQDEQNDRFPTRFGPAEVSATHTEGRVDVTAVLESEAFGRTVADRLRQLEACGFLVRKWETYDTRYKDAWNGYEYGPATGGRGILIQSPKLEVTFRQARPVTVDPRAVAFDPREFAAKLKARGGSGSPTATMPDAEELQAFAARLGFARPAWMADWQWQRVQELAAADPKHPAFQFPVTLDDYGKWLDRVLARPYRWFGGHLTPFFAVEALRYGESWPGPVREHMVRYWEEWLMPGRPAAELAHPQGIHGDDNQKYLARTGDWRGNTSFYRAGYTREMSTMNFNHLAVTGALLGGRLTGIKEALDDGRYGLENLPLRLWCWYDGSTQESIDHYYLTLTLLAQKEFANWGPDELDRMMGRSMQVKTIDELIGAYHPGLRRFIATSGRTGIAYLLAIQDGTKHIVHTLSHSGALTDMGHETTVGGMPVLGHDGPPAMVAAQALVAPFADDWTAYTVDEKPLPFYITNSYKQWGGYAATPLQRRAYMGINYGMASQDVVGNECVPFMAQWRRAARQVTSAGELGTLIGKYGINRTNLLDSLFHGTTTSNANGGTHTYGSYTYSMQHKNRLLVFTSPNRGLKAQEYPGTFPDQVNSLQTTLGLMNFEDPATWEIRVDEQIVTAFPITVTAGQRIAIRDGVSYLAVVPLPATDLGRDIEVVITTETGPEVRMQGGGMACPALLIEQYNYRSDTPLAKARWESPEVTLAYGGFAIELGDEAEYTSFDGFLQHLREATLEAQWDEAERTLDVTWRTGGDTIEVGYKPEYEGGPTGNCFPYRRVNGEYAYLANGVERDSTLAAAGRLGRLEKNGATLLSEPGIMTYLQTEPNTGTYCGHNPLPDPAFWQMSVPGGGAITADGRLGMLRVVVQPEAGTIVVDYALRDDQKTRSDVASALLLEGFPTAPSVVLNGAPLGKLVTARVAGRSLRVVPLAGRPAADLPGRYVRARDAFRALASGAVDPAASLIQDWWLVGGFPGEASALFETAFPAEAAMAGNGAIDVARPLVFGDAKMSWQKAIADGTRPLGPGILDFTHHLTPTTNVCAYAYTTITSDRDMSATLLTGSDDTITAWLNGQKVLELDVWRGATPDSERTSIKLRRGVNHLLIKVCQGAGGWALAARLGDEFGLPLTEGVTIGR